jgi:ASC-1-like (ASCH) protein
VTHHLKTLPEYYRAVEDGIKTFEVRKNDRNFKVGDLLVLQEWDSINGYSGDECCKEITYILSDTQFVKEGYVIMGME